MLIKENFATTNQLTIKEIAKQKSSKSLEQQKRIEKRAKRINSLEKSARSLGKILKQHPELSSNCQQLYVLAHLDSLGLAQI